MTDQRRPQSLKAAFAAAEAQREAIERGAFHSAAGTATGARYAEAVQATLAAYEDCSAKVASLGLFSRNETLEDMATKHLPYLLVPYHVAEVVQRLPATASPHGLADGGPAANRRDVLRRARHAYEQFLHPLDASEMLSPQHARLLQTYTDDPQHFSTTGAPAAAAVDANVRRNAKIANARAEKELHTKLGVLKQRQQERREQRRRRRQQLRGLEEEGEQKGGSHANTNSNEDNVISDDDDSDGDDADEDVARELYLAQLAYAVHMAFQSLDMLNREDEMLARVPPPTPQSQPQTADARQRTRNQPPENERSGSAAATAYTERLETVPRGPRGSGPLLSKEGKPLQPFTIVGSSNSNRQDLAKGVFRPGHNLPTMSIDEYLEEERRRGNIIEGGGPSSGLKPEPDEDDMEKADAETMKARAWDEFTEANPRGAGNTLNRG